MFNARSRLWTHPFETALEVPLKPMVREYGPCVAARPAKLVGLGVARMIEILG